MSLLYSIVFFQPFVVLFYQKLFRIDSCYICIAMVDQICILLWAPDSKVVLENFRDEVLTISIHKLCTYAENNLEIVY